MEQNYRKKINIICENKNVAPLQVIQIILRIILDPRIILLYHEKPFNSHF